VNEPFRFQRLREPETGFTAVFHLPQVHLDKPDPRVLEADCGGDQRVVDDLRSADFAGGRAADERGAAGARPEFSQDAGVVQRAGRAECEYEIRGTAQRGAASRLPSSGRSPVPLFDQNQGACSGEGIAERRSQRKRLIPQVRQELVATNSCRIRGFSHRETLPPGTEP
jgi:hypothetical protein